MSKMHSRNSRSLQDGSELNLNVSLTTHIARLPLNFRCTLYSPINENDDACEEMVETAIYDQWILGDKTNFYYAYWVSRYLFEYKSNWILLPEYDT